MRFTPARIVLLSVCAFIFIVGLFCLGQLVEVINAGDVTVIQFLNGNLEVYTKPGPVGQWFGKVTTYNKLDQLWFSAKADQGSKVDESLEVRFNDGAHGKLSGSVAFEMPVGKDDVLAIHQKYGSQDAVRSTLVKTVLEKAIYMTGPMMSSTESYAERRNELLTLIEEQATHGVYQTETHEVAVTDEAALVASGAPGKSRTKKVARLKLGTDGQPVRADRSPLEYYHVKLSNLSLNKLTYDGVVEKQITDQQASIAGIQVSIASAKKAEQDAITAEQSGRADAAKAKWEQEKLNATQVALSEQQKQVAELNANRDKNVAETKANQDKNVAETKAAQVKRVAELARDSAEFTKQEQILLGEGESERRRLVLAADNALQQKLEAYVKVSEIYGNAISNYKGQWVPTITMGGSSTEGGQQGVTGVQELLNILTAKTAKELALDLNLTPKK